MSIFNKLVKIYKAIEAVEKNGHNKSQNYDYVRASDMVNAVRAEFVKNNIYAEINLDFVGPSYTIARAKEKDAPFAAINVKCSVVLHDAETGETTTGSGLGTGADPSDKAVYKAQTGALKYALRNACLVPDENADPEADESVDEVPDFQESRYSKPAPAAQTKPAFKPTPEATPAAVAAEEAAKPSPAPQPTQQTLPGANSSNAPTEEQMTDFRKRFSKLGDDLSTEGKLKASRNKPINRKVLAFMLVKVGATDPAKMTVDQWNSFFTLVDKVRSEEGVQALANQVEEVNKEK